MGETGPSIWHDLTTAGDVQDNLPMPRDVGGARPTQTTAIMCTERVDSRDNDRVRRQQLHAVHTQVFEPAITDHHGHVLMTRADVLCVDFPSVVSAVQCAQQIQARLRTHNAEKEAREQIHVCIGIHLGALRHEHGEVRGEGVEGATQLQTLAEPGAICISQQVYDAVAKQLPLGTVISLGRLKLQGSAQRFPVYALLPAAPSRLRQQWQVARLKCRGWWPLVRTAVTVLMLLWAGANKLTTLFFLPPAPPQAPEAAPPSDQPALPVPDKPSLVVLPFGPQDNDFQLGQSVSVALRTDLATLSGLFVIDIQSGWPFARRDIPLERVSRELGVQYVLTGNARRTPDRVQIAVQLVDATQGVQLWAEHFDRPLPELFAVKQAMTQQVVTALGLKPTAAEQARLGRLPRYTGAAAEAFFCQYYAISDIDMHGEADMLVERLAQVEERDLEPDPGCALARKLGWNGSSVMVIHEFTQQRARDPCTLDRAQAVVQRALTLDNTLPQAYLLLSYIYLCRHQYEEALAATQRALELAPNCAACYVELGQILSYAGRPADALGPVQQGIRLNPRADLRLYYSALGRAYRLTGQYEEAIATYRKAVPGLLTLTDDWFGLALSYSAVGQEKQARAAVEVVLKTEASAAAGPEHAPDSPSHYPLESVRQGLLYKDPRIADGIAAGLRRAGLE